VSGPLVVVGLPTYDHAEHLPEALETLLAQRLGDLRIVVCDDRSSDDSLTVARRYAERDPRVHVEVNERRLGLVGNWMRTLDVARARHPDARYFLPASDHDAWHPRFLTELVAALEREPDAVLAYPRNVRVGAAGEVLRGPWEDRDYTTADPAARLSAASRTMVAGDMIYGLMRLDALAGLRFHRLLVPDRLLLAELAIRGAFAQVPQTLWRRRYMHVVTAERQREAIFPDGVPLWSRAPWACSHLTVLGSDALRGRGVFARVPATQRGRLWLIYAVRTGAILARGQANLVINRLAHRLADAPRPVRTAIALTRRVLRSA
jgi:glycosyltransferase involved in cell wall biosynthesis